METVVRFNNVSKQYRLGLTRASLPSALATRATRIFHHNAHDTETDNLVWALKNVSFELRRGESLALVGPNGAGKTTILKLLANITRPSSGWFETNGQISALIELGAGFHPDLTGRENIYLNGTILGLKRKEVDRRFDEIVAFSELEQFIDTPVKRYSSGMVVRLGFAVASCVEPDILLVDEVLAVGDAAFRLKCMQRIQSLLDQGTSLIFVSHNFYLVQAICSLALYIDRGQVKYHGNARDAVNAYERDLHEMRARKLALGQLEQEQGLADVDITKVEVRGTDDQDVASLCSDQPAQVLIHYVAYQPVDSVNVAVHITRSDGITCCMIRTSLDNVRLSLHRGSGIISVGLDPLQLISGTYYAEAHLLNASDSLPIKGASSDWFSVTGSALSYEERSGVFKPKTRWEHYQKSLEEPGVQLKHE